jgi:predicted nucleotidyltransferase
MFEKIIRKLGRLLDSAKIPYMIIGGQAVLIYGTPRLTRDIDITLGVNLDKLPEVVKVVNTANLMIIPAKYKRFVAQTMVLPTEDKSSGIRVDFIFSSTSYEQQAIQRTKKVKIGQVMVNFAALEDIIIHKIFAGRPRDLEDAQSIIIKNSYFDRKYIRHWLKLFADSSETEPDLMVLFNRLLKSR